MLFNRETDTGDRITGYVVPDGYSTIPRIRVLSDGNILLVMDANESRPALLESQRHETGLCGFCIDTTMIPDLASRQSIEIRDEESGLLIYRRPRPTDIARRLVRIETDLMPSWRLDNKLMPLFQYSLARADMYGRETATQLFHLHQVQSAFLSGRLLYRNYSTLIEEKYAVIAIIRDPFEQMAERLLVLSKIRGQSTRYISDRDFSYFEPTIAFAESLAFGNMKELKRTIGQMSAEVAATLANPLVRQLTTGTPTDMPEGGAVASALDILSTFALIGLRRDSNTFLRGVEELLDLSPHSLAPLPEYGAVTKLAEMLRATRLVTGLIDKDLELYHYLSESFRKLEQSADLQRPDLTK